MSEDIRTKGLKWKTPFTFALLESGDESVIRARIDGPIGFRIQESDGTFWGETAASFLNAVSEAKAEKPSAEWLEVDLNSPGGIFNDAVAIKTGLADLGLKIRFRTTGISASAAAYLAVCGDEHVIAEDASMMIHEASGGVYGSASQIAAYAESVANVNDVMIRRMSEKSGKEYDEIAALIDGRDYWMGGLDAVAMGFADATTDAAGIAACADAEELEALGAPADVLERAADAEAEPEEPAPAPESEVDEPAPLSDEAQAAIRTACALFDAQDRAEAFIHARASLEDVRKELFAARAAADEAARVDTRIQPAAPAEKAPQGVSLAEAGRAAIRHLNSRGTR